MNWRDHIDCHPDVLGGKPKIRGTRFGVELTLERLGDGRTVEQLLEAYPHITRERIISARPATRRERRIYEEE